MKKQNLKLQGKKVFLRRPLANDADEFIGLNKSSRRLHRNLVNPPLDSANFEDFLERAAMETNESLFICDIESGEIAGVVNLSQIFRRGFQNSYLGYYIGAKFAGQGLMKEAVALILKHAFVNLKLHRIEANVQPQNTASIAVLKANGFCKEGFSEKYLKIAGRWRDHERWAIIEENWNRKK